MAYVIPLGTASALPAAGRHLAAWVLDLGRELLLFDCGEGTQQRLHAAGLKMQRLRAVFITHLHGDHCYGLFGLLSTMTLLGRRAPLELVGPEGLAGMLAAVPGTGPDDLAYPLHVRELEPSFTDGAVYATDAYTVRAAALEHRLFTVGYRWQERPAPGPLDAARARALGVPHGPLMGRLKAGEAVTLPGGRRVAPGEVVGPPPPPRSMAYVSDTRPCAGGRRLAAGADLLVHEATFGAAHAERAAETGHSTAAQAAAVARAAGARRLLLTHFSARYDAPDTLVAEARARFENTEAAEELKRYPLERAAPLGAVHEDETDG